MKAIRQNQDIIALITICFALGGLMFFLTACGGAGGDTPKEQLPTSQTIQCAHDGDVWLCNEEGSCIRDDSEYTVEGVEERGLRVRLAYSTGNITIIAECGSHVTYVANESSDDDVTNAAANLNIGLNQASQ